MRQTYSKITEKLLGGLR